MKRRAESPVDEALGALSALGATVVLAKRATASELARAEDALGFELPSDLREFFAQVGGVHVELERTWNFYGLADALKKTAEYREHLDSARADAMKQGLKPGPYYPARFIVLYDEGDYANRASGTVYDADLQALIVTAGARWVDKEDAFAVDYGGYVLDELDEIRERIADADDILVAGGTRDVERQRQERSAGEKAPRAAEAVRARDAAIAEAYRVFATYPAPTTNRFCFNGRKCKECKAWHEARTKHRLSELPARALFHYAYFADLELPAAQVEYKHYIPRILQVLDDLAAQGSRSVVIGQLLRSMKSTGLTPAEDAIIDAVLHAQWDLLLESPTTTRAMLADLLQPIANQRGDVRWYLETWTKRLEAAPTPLDHAATYVAGHYFKYDAAGHGWPVAPFAQLRAWLLSPKLAAALERAGKEDALHALP